MLNFLLGHQVLILSCVLLTFLFKVKFNSIKYISRPHIVLQTTVEVVKVVGSACVLVRIKIVKSD